MRIDLNTHVGLFCVGVSLSGVSVTCMKAIEILSKEGSLGHYGKIMFHAQLLIGASVALISLANIGFTLLGEEFSSLGKRCIHVDKVAKRT